MNQLIIGIPGPWKDQSEIIGSVAKANPNPEEAKYLALGGLIMDMRTNESFGFEIYEHDPGLKQAFEYAGQGKFTEEELDAIGKHKHTVYIVCGEPFASPEREDLAAARSLLELGAFMLDAGGLAVKIECTGVAHTADRWKYYAVQGTTLSLYDSFVTLIGSEEYNYTCGMHTFGLPDVSLTADISAKEAPYIMNGFNQYQLLESPELLDGKWFTTSHSEPMLKMSHCDYGYDEEDLLNNPYGRWHLELSKEAPPENTTKFQTGGEPMFMALSRDDPEVIETAKQAQASFPWFISHFQSLYEYGSYLVKTRIQDGEESAFIWSLLTDVSGQELKLQLFEMPEEFVNYKAGQQLIVKAEDICDWSIERNSTLIGGFSRRLQRKYLPPEEIQEFDLYSGTIAYAPVEECLKC